MLTHDSNSNDDTCKSNIIDSAIISFDQIGFLPLSFVVLCGWFILNKFYNLIVKVLLSRLCIKDYEVKRLLTVYWNISFTTITIPFALQALSIPIDQFISEFYANLESNVSMWFAQEPVTLKTKMIYILLTGFFLNKVCQISIEKGLKNVDFVISEFFAVFFVSSFAYRCIRFGIAFMILYNIAQSLLEFTRMLYCFSKIYPSKMADICTRFMLVAHIIAWMVIFFHLIPNNFLLLTMRSVITSIDDASHVLILMLLNAALWGFYILHVTSSPLTKLLWVFVLQQPSSLEWLLFGTCLAPIENQQTAYTSANTSQLNNVNQQLKMIPAAKKSFTPIDDRKMKSRENLSKVYQTVKCYIRLKRKLDRIRIKLKEEREKQSIEDDKSEEIVAVTLCNKDDDPFYEEMPSEEEETNALEE